MVEKFLSDIQTIHGDTCCVEFTDEFLKEHVKSISIVSDTDFFSKCGQVVNVVWCDPLHCMVLCCRVVQLWYSMIWYGTCMVWCRVAWHGMAWHGMAQYGTVWYGMVWYGVVYGICYMVQYDMV